MKCLVAGGAGFIVGHLIEKLSKDNRKVIAIDDFSLNDIKSFQQNKSPVINGDGNQTRDFSYVIDVIEANIKAAFSTNPLCLGESFNIGASRNISVNDVVKNIKEITKSSASPSYGPAVIEPKNTLADIIKAKTLLDWYPKYSFEQGIKETRDFFSG